MNNITYTDITISEFEKKITEKKEAIKALKETEQAFLEHIKFVHERIEQLEKDVNVDIAVRSYLMDRKIELDK